MLLAKAINFSLMVLLTAIVNDPKTTLPSIVITGACLFAIEGALFSISLITPKDLQTTLIFSGT